MWIISPNFWRGEDVFILGPGCIISTLLPIALWAVATFTCYLILDSAVWCSSQPWVSTTWYFMLGEKRHLWDLMVLLLFSQEGKLFHGAIFWYSSFICWCGRCVCCHTSAVVPSCRCAPVFSPIPSWSLKPSAGGAVSVQETANISLWFQGSTEIAFVGQDGSNQVQFVSKWTDRYMLPHTMWCHDSLLQMFAN